MLLWHFACIVCDIFTYITIMVSASGFGLSIGFDQLTKFIHFILFLFVALVIMLVYTWEYPAF